MSLNHDNLNRPTFNALMQCYKEGRTTVEERNFIEQLRLSLAPEKHPENGAEWSLFEDELWNKILSNPSIRRTYTRFITPPQVFIQSDYFKISLVACLFLVLSYAVFWFSTQNTPINTNNIVANNADGPTEMTNTTSQVLNISLEDGTSILLKPTAKITYPAHFTGNTREISLTGEAYFDVSPNPDKPFLIYTGDMVTKVVGTSFSINNSPELNSVEVIVHSGKVTVYKKSNSPTDASIAVAYQKSIVLTPNHKVTYFPQTDRFLTGIIDKPYVLTTVEHGEKELKPLNFVYNDTPLSTVIQNLESSYGIHIELANPDMNNCPLTANLSKQPLFTKLKIICSSLNAKFKINGSYVTIDGTGCQ